MKSGYKIICGLILSFVAICVVLLLNFYLKTYTVTYDTKGGTIYASKQIKRGQSAPQPEDPVMEGYTFLGWFIGDSEYDFNTPIMENTTIIAKWQQNESLPE